MRFASLLLRTNRRICIRAKGRLNVLSPAPSAPPVAPSAMPAVSYLPRLSRRSRSLKGQQTGTDPFKKRVVVARNPRRGGALTRSANRTQLSYPALRLVFVVSLTTKTPSIEYFCPRGTRTALRCRRSSADLAAVARSESSLFSGALRGA